MFLRWLYKRNPRKFIDILIEDFYGSAPVNIKEPSIEFLRNGSDVLEPFLSLQAHRFKRRAVLDSKNAEFYDGVLAHIKSLLVVIQRDRKVKIDVDIEPTKEDPFIKVKNFVEEAGKLLK